LPSRRVAKNRSGHSFLLLPDGAGAVSEPEEFARRFRQEILPLLQEYCYDDYQVLAQYIGEELVDREGQVLNEDRLEDPDLLIAALEKKFSEKTT
jgi:5-methylcytosine-specific restriction protein B